VKATGFPDFAGFASAEGKTALVWETETTFGFPIRVVQGTLNGAPVGLIPAPDVERLVIAHLAAYLKSMSDATERHLAEKLGVSLT
jgi:hypothetical protein